MRQKLFLRVQYVKICDMSLSLAFSFKVVHSLLGTYRKELFQRLLKRNLFKVERIMF